MGHASLGSERPNTVHWIIPRRGMIYRWARARQTCTHFTHLDRAVKTQHLVYATTPGPGSGLAAAIMFPANVSARACQKYH